MLGYLDIERRMQEEGVAHPTARQLYDWIVAIRSAKLHDPAVIGNAGSFFKNPTVKPEQGADILGRDPKVGHYPMPDGSVKLAAGFSRPPRLTSSRACYSHTAAWGTGLP